MRFGQVVQPGSRLHATGFPEPRRGLIRVLLLCLLQDAAAVSMADRLRLNWLTSRSICLFMRGQRPSACRHNSPCSRLSGLRMSKRGKV